MLRQTVVVLGKLPVELPPIEMVASEFGWNVESVADLNHLRELSRQRHVVAVLFNTESLGLSHQATLDLVRRITPAGRLIACHRFSDAVNWPELAEAGAFHALALPLKTDEVRQSLGFVYSARLRGAKVLSMPPSDARLEDHSAQLRDAS